MNILQEIEDLYHSIVGEAVQNDTQPQPQTKDTTMTFRDILQAGVADAEAAFVKIDAVYNAAVAKVAATKDELAALEADFSSVLDKDEVAVKAFYDKLAAHFESAQAVEPAVEPAVDPALPTAPTA